MKLETRNLKLGYVIVCVLLVCASLYAVEPFATNYTWSSPPDLEGWTNGFTGGTISNPDGYLKLRFGTQWRQPKMELDFMGTQVAAGRVVTNLQFAFQCANMTPGGVWVSFHSAVSGNRWMKAITPVAPGEWSTNSIDVSFDNNWAAGAETSESQFNTDIQSADWVGVYVQRNGNTTYQNYYLDDFAVSGWYNQYLEEQRPADSDGDWMPDGWELENGFDPLDPTDAGQDADGDQMSNYAEYIAGTDPYDIESRFELEMGVSNKVMGVSGRGLVIEWNSRLGKQYDVYRAYDLNIGFTLHEGNVTATPPKNIYHDITATNKNSYFYRIEVVE